MERLFVLKTLSRTQQATKVKIFVGFSLKPLGCRDPALPLLYGHAYSRPFFLRKACMRIIVFTTWRPFLPVWWCREDSCEFRELPFIMPPSKVCPQCDAVVVGFGVPRVALTLLWRLGCRGFWRSLCRSHSTGCRVASRLSSTMIFCNK